MIAGECTIDLFKNQMERGGAMVWMLILFALTLCFYLIILSWIDLTTGLLPDGLTVSLLWIGLLANPWLPWVSLHQAVCGAALGYGFLWLVYHGFKLCTHREGMGFGDFKLLAALGAWFGWPHLPVLLLIGSVSTLLIVSLLKCCGVAGMKKEIPFGPGLAFAGFCLLLKEVLTYI